MARGMIEVRNLKVRYGDAVAVDDVSFDVQKGEHLTLLGPSGCGKTTTLRAIAGLEKPHGGEIAIDGKSVYSAANRVSVPTENRGVSMVFQSYAIWPHLTVGENVAYGLKVRKRPSAEIRDKIRWALSLVQMQEYVDRPAGNLSGGQQQRVALARAVAFSPAVVLFDEPLSNLDAKLRNEMRLELRDLQRMLAITSVYVTHDQEEALAISDKIVVMNKGRIHQTGTPQDIYDRPNGAFVADFIGSANLISGQALHRNPDGTWAFRLADGQVIQVHAFHDATGSENTVSIRTVYLEFANGPIRGGNVLCGQIQKRVFHGDFMQYVVTTPTGTISIRRPPGEIHAEKENVRMFVPFDKCVLLPADPSPTI